MIKFCSLVFLTTTPFIITNFVFPLFRLKRIYANVDLSTCPCVTDDVYEEMSKDEKNEYHNNCHTWLSYRTDYKKLCVKNIYPIVFCSTTLFYYLIKDKLVNSTISFSSINDKYWVPLTFMLLNQTIHKEYDIIYKNYYTGQFSNKSSHINNIVNNAESSFYRIRTLKSFFGSLIFIFSTSQNKKDFLIHSNFVILLAIFDCIQEFENLWLKNYIRTSRLPSDDNEWVYYHQNNYSFRRYLNFNLWEQVFKNKWQFLLCGIGFLLLQYKFNLNNDTVKIISYIIETITLSKTLN